MLNGRVKNAQCDSLKGNPYSRRFCILGHEKSRHWAARDRVCLGALYVLGCPSICADASIPRADDARAVCRALAGGAGLHGFNCRSRPRAHPHSTRGTLGSVAIGTHGSFSC